MAALQAENICASFLFVGDLTHYNHDGCGCNRHGVATFDFATVCGCDQSVVGPTHVCGGTLDRLITEVPDLIGVAVVAPIGNSDHSSLLAVISMVQAVPNLCVNRKVFPETSSQLEYSLWWNTVCSAIQDLPWHNIRLADNPIEVLKEHLSLLV